MNLNSLRTGDVIVRQKGPFSTHFIVWIRQQNGINIVAENASGHGVRYISLEEALDGKPIIRFEKFGGTEAQRKSVVNKINNMLGRRYDLVAFNCEHFAHQVASGKIESNQVLNTSNLALFGGAALMSSDNASIRKTGIAFFIVGIIGHLSQE